MKALMTVVAMAMISMTAPAAGGQRTEADIAAAIKKADPDNDGTSSADTEREVATLRSALRAAPSLPRPCSPAPPGFPASRAS